jgi:hypothetical protein
MTSCDPHAESPPRAGVREWTGLAVLVLPLLVLALDVSVLYLAAPAQTAGADARAQGHITGPHGHRPDRQERGGRAS